MNFKVRQFISITLLLSFIIISLTGIVLYVSPHGRVAYWINWKFASLTKDDWNAIHTIIGIVFVFMGIIHFSYNWKTFTGYVRDKIKKGLYLKKELAASLLFVTLLTAGTISGIPPFQTIMNMGNSFKASWGIGVEQAPIPHAELMTIDALVENLGLSADLVRNNLDKYGIESSNTKETIKSIAERHSMSPLELYRIIEPVRGGGQGDRLGLGRRLDENGRVERLGLGRRLNRMAQVDSLDVEGNLDGEYQFERLGLGRRLYVRAQGDSLGTGRRLNRIAQVDSLGIDMNLEEDQFERLGLGRRVGGGRGLRRRNLSN